MPASSRPYRSPITPLFDLHLRARWEASGYAERLHVDDNTEGVSRRRLQQGAASSSLRKSVDGYVLASEWHAPPEAQSYVLPLA